MFKATLQSFLLILKIRHHVLKKKSFFQYGIQFFSLSFFKFISISIFFSAEVGLQCDHNISAVGLNGNIKSNSTY